MATFTTTSKSPLSWQAPEATDGVTYFLDIGSGFNLLVATGYKLVTQPGGRADTSWTTSNKYT